MKIYPREFPSGRRKRPKRRAERQVYEALAASNRRGFVFYEWRQGYEKIELDFAVWVEGLGRFALQVKGGHYVLTDGEWYLKTWDGLQFIRSCPLDETWLAALDLHDDIKERARTPYSPYVLPVLAFPDMEPDPAIVNLARRKGAYIVWGVQNLPADLEQIVRSRSVSEALSYHRIAREVHAVTDGLIRLEGSHDADADADADADCGDAETAAVSVRRFPGTVRLKVGGKTIVTIRSSAVRCRLGERIRNGREPKK